jgi:hypothetical protein
MGNCLAVEVREQPVPYYDRSGQLRHTVVRQMSKSAHRRSDELSLYRPRSRLSIRHNDFQPQDDFRGSGRPQADHRNNQRFEPLPPPAPQLPMIHNPPVPPPVPQAPVFLNEVFHDPGPLVDLGGQQPLNHNDEIQVIDDSAEMVSPRSNRGRRQIVPYSPRRRGRNRRYYDDSDDDSWVERSPRIRYSDDSWGEAYRPGRRPSSRRRSRSRNGRYHG